MAQYPLTLSPLRIGGAEIKNRVARTGHATFLAEDGRVGDQLIAYHLARAEGGVGLTILEAAAVHPSSVVSLQCVDDRAIAGYEALVRRVAPTGMKLFQQLWHGGHIFPAADGSPPWAPSSFASHIAGVAARPMGRGDIRALVDAYAAAAIRCDKGGLDGVEIHAGHGYLLAQFLSPLLNERDDEYGGDFDNRLRLLREVLEAVRGAVRPGFAVGVRLSDSADPAVLTDGEVARVARRLAEEGLIDYVNSSYGDYYANHWQLGGMDAQAGFQVPHTAPRVADLGVPRLLNGRFRTLGEIERTLERGEADLISMVRAHIADPHIVAKTLAGQAVRPCIACNQGCVAQAATPGRMGCVVNVAVGAENALDEAHIRPAAAPRQVLVVGGGPAGLEAARVAALGGHKVTLVEASARLGGRLNLCAGAPNMQPMAELARWLEAEARRLGVDVRLSTRLDPAAVAALRPDAVIVAIGADPARNLRQLQRPGHRFGDAEANRILFADDLLSGLGGDLGRSALVVDEWGHYEAVACAEHLLDQGLAVTFVTRHRMFAPFVDMAVRAQGSLERLYAKGDFAVHVASHVQGLTANTALVGPHFARSVAAVAADTVVWVPVRSGQTAFADDLLARGMQALPVGDAVAGRDLQVAIREAHLAARSLFAAAPGGREAVASAV